MTRERTDSKGRTLIYRHGVVTRITHWIIAVCTASLLLTGWFIFLAHPRLYWGEDGFFGDGALFTWANEEDDSRIGWSRSLHFLCAWLLVSAAMLYIVSSVANGHLRRDLLPSRAELRVRHLLRDLREHVTLRFTQGAAARGYNALQKVAYLAVVLMLIPVMILTGLAMSPAVTASYPQLIDLFDGRQSARTVHFLVAALLALFLIVHLVMVLVTGWSNQLRAMLTGWYVRRERP